MRRHRRTQQRRRRWMLGDHLRGDGVRRCPGEWRHAEQHLVGDATEREDVAPPGDFVLAGRLLGAQVVRHAERHAQLAHARASRLRHGERQSPIGDEHLVAGEYDAVGLHVAVRNPPLVRVLQRGRDGGQDADGLVDIELALAGEPGAERLPLHVRHGVEERCVRSAVVPDRQDVGMLQLGDELHLADEQVCADRLGHLWPEDLEGDVAVLLEVACEIDGSHAAHAELSLDPVPDGDRERDPVGARRGGFAYWRGMALSHAGVCVTRVPVSVPGAGRSGGPAADYLGPKIASNGGVDRDNGRWSWGIRGEPPFTAEDAAE